MAWMLCFALQAENAAKDAGTSSRRSSSSASSQQQQQHQQQVQELLEQVADLQAQLAAGAAARAATNAAVAVAGGGAQQVKVLQEEVQQLQAVLEDRTLELQEWQVHADVGARRMLHTVVLSTCVTAFSVSQGTSSCH
jgi:hypothetical protein